MQVTAREQVYGACHVYAATSAVQAACFRRTGRLLPISEGYQFYQHLREAAENRKSTSFLKVVYNELFSENDAGAYSTTLARIQKGLVFLDSDFSMRDLNESLDGAKKIRTEFRALPSWERDAAEPTFETRFREQLIEDMDRAFTSKVSPSVTDPSLAACRPQYLRSKDVSLTPERIVRLLNAAFPVICQFYDSPPDLSSHVYVLTGYRRNATFKNGFELIARDSRKEEISTYGRDLNCYLATVVYAPEEESRLNEALAAEDLAPKYDFTK